MDERSAGMTATTVEQPTLWNSTPGWGIAANLIPPELINARKLKVLRKFMAAGIVAWGGDHTLLEHSFASLCLARDLIADVLAELVDRGYFDVDLALETARRILYANALEFWRIQDALPVR